MPRGKPVAEENARQVAPRLRDYYCARCRKLKPEAELIEDKALGLVCAEGCRK